MRYLLILTTAGVLGLSSCGTQAPSRPVADAKPPQAATTKDETNLFPPAGRVATQVYPDHMMNKQFLPGGTMAEYRTENNMEYRAFVVHLADGRNASFLLEDYKKVLQNSKPAPGQSSYFGTDNGQPTYVFVRGPYLAGIVGLPEDRAQVAARQLADKLS